jgi:hypothetical protein
MYIACALWIIGPAFRHGEFSRTHSLFASPRIRLPAEVEEEERTLLLAVRKPEATVASSSSIEVSFETGPALREFDYTIKCVLLDDALLGGCDADAVGAVVTGKTTTSKSTIEGEVTGLQYQTDYQCYVIVETDKLSKCKYVVTPVIEVPPAPENGWTPQTTSGTGYTSVAWGGPDGSEIFVAVGYDNNDNGQAVLLTSPDGISWSVPAGLSLPQAKLRDVTWGAPQARVGAAGRFVAVSSSPPTVITSEDGVAWAVDQSIPANEWRGVTYSPELGRYVAVAWDDENDNVMVRYVSLSFVLSLSLYFSRCISLVSPSSLVCPLTSSDGLSWTAYPGARFNDWSSVAWSPELSMFAAVAYSGDPNRVMTSPDGDCNWVAVNTGLVSLNDITWGGPVGGKLFVAVGNDPSVVTSTDGITWVSQSNIPSGSWQSVAWGGPVGYELFVAVSQDNVMTSPDGITWTISPGTIPGGEWSSVTYGGPAGSELFAAVAKAASTPSGEHAMTSFSGIGD